MKGVEETNNTIQTISWNLLVTNSHTAHVSVLIMAHRLSPYHRELIIKFSKRGFGPSRIRDEIALLEGITVSRNTISRWIERYGRTCCLTDLSRRHFEPKLSQNHRAFINQEMHNNSELTAAELQDKLIKEFNVDVSKATVTSAREISWLAIWGNTLLSTDS